MVFALRPFRRRPAPSWGVTIFAREPPALVLVNLAWHIEMGARELNLYLDDPDDPVGETAARLPGVCVTRCDAAFWQRHGARPAWNNQRQAVCASQAYRQTGVDWLVHLDADEFLHSRRPLAGELAGLSPQTDALVFPPRERAFTAPLQEALFEGVFRIPQPRGRPPHPLLAPNAAFCPQGVSGHALGKSATRAGLDVTIGPHAPRGGPRGSPVKRPSDSTVLLHFDGLTARSWLLKFLRYGRLMERDAGKNLGDHRIAQLAQVSRLREDPVAMLAFHDRIKLCADEKNFVRAGLAERIPFDPLPAARKHLGALPDLSPASFDDLIRTAEPDLMHGL